MLSFLPLVAGVIGFVVVVLPLVALILAARSRLLPSGEVDIVINEERERALRVAAGANLLDTLSQRNILLSSACGGQGTCGACKVRVVHGGGQALPTERGHLSRTELTAGVRLACQLKVRESLDIELPPQVFGARKWLCTVRSNRNVATFIKELVLELPVGESVPFRAGGYVQVEVPPHRLRYSDFDIAERFRDEWDRHDLWRYSSSVDEVTQRAYSMANYPGETGILILNVRIASPPPDAPGAPPGIVSSYIFGLKPGDSLTISGPFGEFFARDTDAEMMFIGGGAGMAPMRSHILDQLKRLQTDRKITFWYGARSLREAFYVDEFERLAVEHDNFDWTLALSTPLPEDHWSGPTGLIHQVALDRYLQNHTAPEDIEYYLCGPPPMVEACEQMLDELGVAPDSVLFDKF